jgi:RNA polymerase sigma-70 factor (ECF subfamily)
MNITRGTVRIHLYRALQKLKAADALRGDTP